MTGTRIPRLGDSVKDIVTGFAGTVTGTSEYLNGCKHYLVEAKPKVGSKSESEWIDEARLKVTRDGAALRVRFGLEPPKAQRPGGPAMHEPPRH